MRYKSLLNKTKFRVIVILVVLIQMLGPQQFSTILNVNSEGLTGTEPNAEPSTEPKITITSPKTDEFLKESNITFSGTVENYTAGMNISLFNGTEQIGTPYEVNGNSWSITDVFLPEGTYNIEAKLVDAGEITVASTTITHLTIDQSLPNVAFVNLVDGAFFKSRSIEMATELDAIVQICMGDCDAITGPWVTVPKDSNGRWIFTNPQMTEGPQTVYAKAIDRAGNIGPTNRISFTLDTLRPTILLNSIVPTYIEDMTQVSISTEIKFRVLDANALNETVVEKSIRVTSNGKDVPGEVLYDPDTKEFSYILTDGPLTSSTKYNVFISPLGVIDAAGNSAFPKFWSFTTESVPTITDQESGKNLYKIDYNGINGEKVHRESPHAAYASNVNVCANCHNTHEAGDRNLLEQKQNSENGSTDTFVDDYCMACHDGTVAPKPENSDAKHKHSAAIDVAGKPSGSSCASCHNPHNERSEDNPNLAQDHISYIHDPSIIKDDKPVGKISTKEQLCESCHESGMGALLAQPDVDAEYRVFQYKKNISSIGIYEDYDLCLRCHNLDTKNKYSKIADIARFYNNLTEESKKAYETDNPGLSYSEREFSVDELEFSRHIIKSQDGSPLAGHLPCAECHDTHGSNNVKQLNGLLGHEGQESFTADDTHLEEVVDKNNPQVKYTILSVDKERAFCIVCHKGTTSLYGVTGTKYDESLPQKMKDNELVWAHRDNSNRSCSECHGGVGTKEEKALKAAHAPQEGIIP